MGNALGVREVEEGKTGDMETLRTATSDSVSPPHLISESDTLVLASTIPDDFTHLLEEAIAVCEEHERTDIIITYMCNLQVFPKEVSNIATELKYIGDLQGRIKSTFVPIRY